MGGNCIIMICDSFKMRLGTVPFFLFSIICSLTIKSGAWIWHLDAILALGGGNFKEQIFKSSNARDIAQEGPGCLNFKLIDAYNFKEFS